MSVCVFLISEQISGVGYVSFVLLIGWISSALIPMPIFFLFDISLLSVGVETTGYGDTLGMKAPFVHRVQHRAINPDFAEYE